MKKTIRRPLIALIGVVLGVVLGAILVACGSGGNPSADSGAGGTSSYLYERTITLKDGRTVTCVIYGAGNAGGLSCDWDSTRR